MPFFFSVLNYIYTVHYWVLGTKIFFIELAWVSYLSLTSG